MTAFAESRVHGQWKEYGFLLQFMVVAMMRVGNDLARNEPHVWDGVLRSISMNAVTESSSMMSCFIGISSS